MVFCITCFFVGETNCNLQVAGDIFVKRYETSQSALTHILFLCLQVATGAGTMSHYFNLHIVVPAAFILGSGEYHIGEGSTISLVCIIENVSTPELQYWASGWLAGDQIANALSSLFLWCVRESACRPLDSWHSALCRRIKAVALGFNIPGSSGLGVNAHY